MFKIYWRDTNEEKLKIEHGNHTYEIDMEYYEDDLTELEENLPPLVINALRKALQDFWQEEEV